MKIKSGADFILVTLKSLQAGRQLRVILYSATWTCIVRLPIKKEEEKQQQQRHHIEKQNYAPLLPSMWEAEQEEEHEKKREMDKKKTC